MKKQKKIGEVLCKAVEPVVGVFRRSPDTSKADSRSKQVKLSPTRLLPNPKISVDDVAALFGEKVAAKLSNENFHIITEIPILCYMLFDCKKLGLTPNPENDDRWTSDEIHEEMNRLLKEFRKNKETDYTDFQLVEMMLLFSRCFAPLEECWSLYSFETVTSRVRVDGWDGESYLDGEKIIHDKEKYIYPDTEYLLAFFALPGVEYGEWHNALVDEIRNNLSGNA